MTDDSLEILEGRKMLAVAKVVWWCSGNKLRLRLDSWESCRCMCGVREWQAKMPAGSQTSCLILRAGAPQPK